MKKTETFTNNAEETIGAEETIRIELSGEEAFCLLYAAEKSLEIREILEAVSRRNAASNQNVG